MNPNAGGASHFQKISKIRVRKRAKLIYVAVRQSTTALAVGE